MSNIGRFAEALPVRAAVSELNGNQRVLVGRIIEVQQIPAPTFQESARASFLEDALGQLGLENVGRDEMDNVFGRLSGTESGTAAPVIVSAHSDTVFPYDTDLTVRRESPLLFGPGIGDNATGVAGILTLAGLLVNHQLRPRADVWFVFNVGEEGMGNLCGMREVVARFGRQATYVVVEGGSFGQIIHEAIGVHRLRVEVTTAGGHSWGRFGQPSAIHELCHIVADIDSLPIPASPKTTYNVGVISGGTTVNSIAMSAKMLLDLRSESQVELTKLVNRVRGVIELRRRRATASGKPVEIRVEQVGDRPSGHISKQVDLIENAVAALENVGCTAINFVAGSTDANIPLSMGSKAVCVGLTVSGNSHRNDEYIDTRYLPQGMKQLLLLTLATAGWEN